MRSAANENVLPTGFEVYYPSRKGKARVPRFNSADPLVSFRASVATNADTQEPIWACLVLQ